MLWIKISKSKEVVSLLFCILSSFFFLTFNSNIIVRLIGGFQHIGNSVSSSIDSFGSIFKSLINKIESYDSIREERNACVNLLDEYKLLPQDLKKLEIDNKNLRAELQFQPITEYPKVKSEIIAVRLNSIYKIIIIDKGEKDGIKPFMPVVSRAINLKGEMIEAVVGKVISTSNSSSIVQPILNANFNMGARLFSGDLWANLTGNSEHRGEVILNYIDHNVVVDPNLFKQFQMGPNEIIPFSKKFSKIGETVYSSGDGGIIPPGIPVGIIVEEGKRDGEFKTAFVKPFVDFSSLKFVTVILKLPEKWAEQWPENISVKVPLPEFEQGELKNKVNKNETLENKESEINNTPTKEGSNQQ